MDTTIPSGWECSVFANLVEGIVLKDRKVAFNDLNDENGEEIGVGVEDAAFESKGKSDKK